jgi:N-methylhydantoinase A
MCEALRIVSIERGLDPAEFSLIAFGGAGPVHAVALAAELGIPTVLLPLSPGAFSAVGLIASDLRRDYSRTFYSDVGSADPATLGATIDAMEQSGQEMLTAAAVPPERQTMQRFADLRYPRQAYELTVPMEGGAITRASLDRLMVAFHDKHRQTYSHANPGERVQMVNVRLSAMGKLPPIQLAQQFKPDDTGVRHRDTWFPATGTVSARVHWRDGLMPNDTVVGPAVIDALDCTSVVPPGWAGTVDEQGFIYLRRTA